jgi:16S rRNA (guanine527-N7)-methyltransferase
MDELVQNSEQKKAFETLLTELKAWNAHTNLTAIREDKDIIAKHFADSLSVLQAISNTAKNLIDIGTGAGFPGLPIAIMRPDIAVTLVESVGKKTAFIEHIKKTLALTNVTVINARAEDVAQLPEHREQYDVATARAVAELTTLSEYVLPFIKVGGIFIAQKNVGNDEIVSAENALHILGGKIERQIPITISGLSDRQLIVIAKIHATPKEYPRHSGIPAKKPL